MKKILFGYRLSNADCCTYGDDDGFLFAIYVDGTAIYNKYVVEDTIVKSRKFKVSDRTVSEINAILDRYNNKIFRLKKNLDNGSYDGTFSIFTFRSKEITTLNIEEHNIKLTAVVNPEYFIKYRKVMIQENIIMKIFREICAVLRKNHAIRLKLESVFIPLWLYIEESKMDSVNNAVCDECGSEFLK
ncbi:MAG: hypothetical protein NC177_03125 [Ruminococcus flavefaciens]|nr:hypothetical protein [Ruminococcus flavefaciens]